MTKEKRTISIMLLILAPFLFVAIYSYEKSKSNMGPQTNIYSVEEGSSAEKIKFDFDLNDLDGNVINFSRFEGKVVVVNFWATWCKYCVMEIPGFNSIYSKYKSKGLEIVGISLDKSGPSRVKEFVKRTRISYPIFLGAPPEALRSFGTVSGLPTTFFLSREGKVVDSKVGILHENELESIVKKLL